MHMLQEVDKYLHNLSKKKKKMGSNSLFMI